MKPYLFETISFIFGLTVGSFLNVCIYRLPRGLSIVRPGSACPACNSPVMPWDNIPVLSFLLLRGKCRRCGGKISLRYPLVEMLNGVFYWLLFIHFGAIWGLPLLFAFVSAMIVITFIDLDFQIIPDVISLPGIVLGVLGAAFILPDPFTVQSSYYARPIVGVVNSLAGLLAGGGLFYLIALIGGVMTKRDAMGGGDIKMMAMVGAFMGWKAVLLTTFAGSLAGSVAGIFLMAFKGKGREAKIPFGPFLSLGAVITLFLGQSIIKWYLGI